MTRIINYIGARLLYVLLFIGMRCLRGPKANISWQQCQCSITTLFWQTRPGNQTYYGYLCVWWLWQSNFVAKKMEPSAYMRLLLKAVLLRKVCTMHMQ